MTAFASCAVPLTGKEKDIADSFGEILKVHPAEDKEGWYQLTSPDGGVKFVFSNDSASLIADCTPFISAGLQADKLENVSETIFYKTSLGFTLPGWDMLNQNVKDTALAQFEADIRNFKVAETEESYKINFADIENTRADSAVFEWAKVISSGDRDIVFRINAQPLTEAGVDPLKVEGWDYIEASDGVWEFQKIFDLNR